MSIEINPCQTEVVAFFLAAGETLPQPLLRESLFDERRVAFPLNAVLVFVAECKSSMKVKYNCGLIAVVGKLLLKSNGVTLLPLLVRVTRYLSSVTHFSLKRLRYSH